MSLKYALVENLLTSRTNDYVAKPQEVRSHDLASITERMIQKGSTITKTDTLAVLNTFFEVVKEITQEGETIHTELIHTNFSIQGVFDSATEKFDPKKQKLKINVNAGKKLKKALPLVTLEKTTTTEPLPNLVEVKDSISGSVNDRITSGGVVEIIGSMLKVEGTKTANGVFFTAQDGTAHKVNTIVENKPSKLIVICPTLTPGKYTLQVTTQYSGSKQVKETKTGTFHKQLTVA